MNVKAKIKETGTLTKYVALTEHAGTFYVQNSLT